MSLQEYTTPQGVICYDRRGIGDPLVLVHGLYPGASHDEYAHNVPELQRHFTVYSMNLLGFGQSDVPRITHTAEMHQHMLRDFLAEVVQKPAYIVASGVSCGIAARLGVYDDALVSRLVLISPQLQKKYKEELSLADKLAHFVLGTLSAGFSIYEVEASDEGLDFWVRDNYHDPRKFLKSKIPALLVEANEPNKMMAHISVLCGYFDTDLAHWLPYVRRPTQVVMGADLMPVPVDQWFRPAQWSMGKRLDVVDQARAFPHEEQSAATTRLIVDFLENRLLLK